MTLLRRAEVTDGAEIRGSRPVDVSVIARFHSALSSVQIELPTAGRVTTTRCREAMGTIRVKRNAVIQTIGWLDREQGGLKADLVTLGRLYEAEKTARWDRMDVFAGTTNEKQRDARVRSTLSVVLDAQAAVEADLARVAAALSHARQVLEELRGAFDEVSRLLASVELDWKIAHGER